jgi:hypothetical protein
MEDTPKTSFVRRRMIWWIGGAVALALVVGVAAWFFSGPKVWTDGGVVRISDRGSRVREVAWTRPVPLEGFSSEEQVYEPSISPDGTELYFVRGKAGQNAKIFSSLRKHNAWSAPVAVDAVNGPFDALGPRVTADGNYLLFYSNRPGGIGGYDIWAALRTESGWGEPFNLGPEVNSEFNEFNPDPTPDGKKIFFATNRASAKREQHEAWRSTIRETVSSDYDLWQADAELVATPGLPATQPTTRPIGRLVYRHAREVPGVNTPFTEGASCMSPAGDFLYFASNRPGGFGKFDIYRCRVHGEEFGPVENAGLPVNSPENEADPALAYNGFRMLYSSDRPGADGRYYLLASDSREVYPERSVRPMPHLGWSWWLLIISLLALIPLLLMMKGWDEHRLSMIQKCLLMSLLVHALITFVLSFVAVTQQVTQYVQKQMQMEIAVNLGDSRGVDETLAIRSQMSGDLPVSSIAPPSLAQTKVETETVTAPAAVSMDVPTARAVAGGMVLAAPHTGTPAPQEALAKVTPNVGVDSAVDVGQPQLQRVAQTEKTISTSSAQASVERQVSINLPTAMAGASSHVDVPAAAVNIARASDVAAPSVRPHADAGTATVDVKATPVASAESANSPEPATNGTLPRVAKAVGAEPTFAVARSGPTTQAIASASAVPPSEKATTIELAGANRAAPTTIPSIALAAAVVLHAPSEPTGQENVAPKATDTISSATVPDVSSKSSPVLAAKLVGKELDAQSTTGSTVQAQKSSQAKITGPAPTEMVHVADAKPSARLSAGSNLSSAPPRPSANPGSVTGQANEAKPAASVGTATAPNLSPTLFASAVPGGKAGAAEASPVAGSAGPAVQKARTQGASPIGVPTSIDIAPAPIVAAGKSPAGGKGGLGMGGIATAHAELASAIIQPEVSIAAITGPLGPGKSVVPDLPFIRAPEQRKPMLEQFGGTKESEDAVMRGLAWLAKVQEEDGHWSRIEGDGGRRRIQMRSGHDMACTAFSVLAYLGHDETPDKPCPYRDVVTKGVDYLINQQGDDGDLRGASRFKGGGADSANMYDHGIATYALAECAIMTHDPRVTAAAIKGAQFIVDAQNQQSGGWRYSPNEYGDSSVFGWQIMALHSAEQVGFKIPQDTLDGAKRYITSCGQGRYRLLAGYQPHQSPTTPMTAELLFSRMLLGMPMSDDGVDEATRFLARQPPDPRNADLYYWYYASLSMLHMQNPLWKDWNVLTREALIAMQESDGPAAGSWDTSLKWGERGGRVFTTALATLTLEVYYRYLPMRQQPQTQKSANQ